MSPSEIITARNTPIIKNATINQAPTRLENLENQLSVNPITGKRETG